MQGFDLTQEELDLLTELVDDDHSGEISYREFGRIFNKGTQLVVDIDDAAAAMLTVMEESMKKQESIVIEKFKAVDDGDGMLTLEEFKVLIRSVCGAALVTKPVSLPCATWLCA